MRCIMLVVHTSGTAWAPKPEAMAAMGRFNDEMRAAGILVDANGFHPPSEAVRVTHDGAEVTVKQGHSSVDGEVVGGYWMLQVDSLATAEMWAKKVPFMHDTPVVVEIRQVAEFD